MKQYKHYSFDLWLTLIKSNPEFKRKRAEYFHSHFNRVNKTIEEIEIIIREIDIMCNWTNETIGGNIDAFEMYSMILHKLDYDLKPLSHRDIQSIYHTIETIFYNYPPVLYDNDTEDILNKLRQRGSTISILSNTGYIKGSTLRKLLFDMNISQLTSFYIYSDEVKCSKPDIKIFNWLTHFVNEFRKFDPILITDIVHVGDNPHADSYGAAQAGLDSILINSNGKTIKDIL